MKQGLHKTWPLKTIAALILMVPLQALASAPYEGPYTLQTLLETWLHNAKMITGIATSTPMVAVVCIIIAVFLYQTKKKIKPIEETLRHSHLIITLLSINYIIGLVLEHAEITI